DGGGGATLIRVAEIENLNADAVAQLFNEARAADYEGLRAAATELLNQKRMPRDEAYQAEMERLKIRFEEIRGIDFFESPRAHDVERLVRRMEESSNTQETKAGPLAAKDYCGKTWVT